MNRQIRQLNTGQALPQHQPQSRVQNGSKPALWAQPLNQSRLPTQSPSLDLSDFPALGTSSAQSLPQHSQFRSNGPGPSPGMEPVRPMPPGLPNRGGVNSSNSTEDFPALPGKSIRSPASQFAGVAAAAAVADNANKSSSPSQSISQSDMDKYGMNGLLGVIRMENNDQTAVAIGNDLTNLGLSFHPIDEPLSRTFGSPWVETAKHKVEPEFKLPSCYQVPSAPPQQQKIQSLTEETLFYIFYTMPKDSMQEAAALELTNRNWRYHKELKLWLTKDPLTEPIQQTSQAERGIYVFFDPSTWEKVKKEYVLYYPDIA